MTSQKDLLFDSIEAIKLSPSQFEITERKSKFTSGVATMVTFKNSEFFFLFETSQRQSLNHYALFTPGKDSFHETEDTMIWDAQFRCFKNWLSYVVREITAPNKWDRLQNEINNLGITISNGEDKFSALEFENLKEKLLQLKNGITSLGLLPEQISSLNNKIDHLAELAKTMNKFDWKGLFIGTIMSIIIQLSVTPENAKSLWQLIKQIFSSFLLQ